MSTEKPSMYYMPIYDLFLDLPHPAASAQCDSAKIIGPHPSNPDACSRLQEDLFGPDTISKISKYAFPDHNDQVHTTSMSYGAILKALSGNDGASVPCLNRYDIYLHNFTTPHYHTFLLRLSCGVRIHGHVRRYLPHHPEVPSRADVGRRGVRAMVILTRSPGGEQFWTAVLRTLESISLGLEDPPVARMQTFLFKLHENHRLLFDQYEEPQVYEGSYDTKNQQSNCSVVKVAGIEFGANEAKNDLPRVPHDVVSFRLPPSLQPGYTKSPLEDIDAPLLPLLRRLHTSHYMRLLSALLCERRVILISDNLSRLSACVQGAAAMLAQGLLVWQHVFIPVLPPHLLKYLATPTPYLIGLLEPYARNLDIIPGMGGVLCVNLDSNSLWTFNVPDPSMAFPDLIAETPRCKTGNRGGWIDKDKVGGGGSQETATAIDGLVTSLKAVLKSDRKMWVKATPALGEARVDVLESDSPTNFDSDDDVPVTQQKTESWNIFKSVKGPRIVPKHNKSSAIVDSFRFHRSRDIHKSLRLAAKLSEATDDEESSADENDAIQNAGRGKLNHEATPTRNSGKPLNSTAERRRCNPWDGRENESGEEAIRIALVSFYLFLYGDLGMYLTEDEHGTLYLDRKKLLLLRKIQGDAEHTAIFRVLANLSRSSTFDQFVKARIEELESEDPDDGANSNFAPLFYQCQKHLLLSRTITENIADMVKGVADSRSQRRLAAFSEVIRERALSVASKRQEFDDMAVYETLDLAHESREVVITLQYVMGVIWGRMSKTGNGRYRLFALHMLRLLLLHGPVTVISDAAEGLHLVRSLIVYKSKGDESESEVRKLAACVHDLILDRPKLFSHRRQCMGRKAMKGHLQRNPRWFNYLATKLPVTTGFSQVHVLFRPSDEILEPRRKRRDFPQARPESVEEDAIGEEDSGRSCSVGSSFKSSSVKAAKLRRINEGPTRMGTVAESNGSDMEDGGHEKENGGDEDDDDDDYLGVYSVGWSIGPDVKASLKEPKRVPVVTTNISSRSDFSDNSEGKIPPESAFRALFPQKPF